MVSARELGQTEGAAHPPHLAPGPRRSPRTRRGAARPACGRGGRRGPAGASGAAGASAPGIGTSSPRSLHRDEGDDLVERPFHEELHLAVLVGGADRGDRRGPDVHRPPLAVHPLAQALGPELPVPLGELPQPVGVRHQHVDPGAELGVGGPVQRGVERGRVPQQVVRTRRARPRARAPASRPAMSMPTSAAGSRPTGESTLNRPPTSGGTSSVAIPSRVASSRRAPRVRIGGEHQVAGRRVAERLLQPGADHQVLRHRLRGAARLADHVDQHPPRVDPRERGARPSSGRRSPGR